MPTTGIYGKSSPKPSLEDLKPFTTMTVFGKGNTQNFLVLLDTGS